MANGHKCKDKSVVEAEESKRKREKDDFDNDEDKDKDTPKSLNARVKRLERLLGVRVD